MRWDPVQYALYADQRSRPFMDLVDRVAVRSPQSVLDIGCGSGQLTVSLARRWPTASVHGVDSSPEMIRAAPRGAAVTFTVDTAEHVDVRGADVVVSNAVLQWVTGHGEVLARWAEQLDTGSWLAFQVPANFDAPSHVLMRELAGSEPWREQLDGVLRGADAVEAPEQYLDLLAGRGLVVDAWQTEYLHVLPGRDPVLDWVRGTGLRPVLEALGHEAADDFCAEYAALLRAAYPERPYGTVFPFLRTFVVAHKAG